MWKKVISRWYLVLLVLFFLGVIMVYDIFAADSYIAVHDNMDLFIAQFQMLKNTDSFFSQHVSMPFLGGVTRDALPSELSLYSVLYMFLPSFTAYIAGYLIKAGIGVLSVWLLAKDWYQEEFPKYRCIVVLMGLAYGILNMFPTFGICFSSIPLVIYLLRKIYRKPSVLLYGVLFCYPFISYFSYFGFFILAYLTVAVIWIFIRDRKFPKQLLGALAVLGLGFVVFEYRLFGMMLFDQTETIRATMIEADLTAGEVLRQSFDVWKNGMFHAESVHTLWVLPVCLIYFAVLNGQYVKEKNVRGMFRDVYNLLMLILVFNSFIYGIYNWGAFRHFVEDLIPPLKGFQFNRTVFFNPFLWYAAFFLVLQRLYSLRGRKYIYLANAAALICIAVILVSPTRYNDLYATCKNKALEILKGRQAEELSYEEFYSTALFEQIKNDIAYAGEWSAAYGIHPAVLEYNGIATLDGYLGFYPQEYKQDFRRIIAPALDRVEASRIYYDNWGARVYLYSGTDLSAVSATKSVHVTDSDIYIDAQAFEELGGKYIFSRIEFSNAAEAGLTLIKSYAEEESPYIIYLYER